MYVGNNNHQTFVKFAHNGLQTTKTSLQGCYEMVVCDIFQK